MAARVLELVPNFSEGRDLDVVDAIVEAMEDAGAEVVDRSADADHHRSVVTAFAAPEAAIEASVAAARVAAERIDLRRHRGVHPRIGALDVLPFVPLVGSSLSEAATHARRAGERIASEVGLPVYFYAAASEVGRGLAELRRGGFEALVAGWPADRRPDVLPDPWPYPGVHPTAGACCVGARRVLLAWNVYLEEVGLAAARGIAMAIRERDGGFPGLRALALLLPSRGEVQVSMNLEDPSTTSPEEVLRRIASLAETAGGRIGEVEVIGLVPDELSAVLSTGEWRVRGRVDDRILSHRLAEYLTKSDHSGAASG